ncbi:MAG TPA: ABC transporter permease [Roseiflexaceae bacterium]|jgi:peptide/nickel transport system permease protein|nr:ABC transporter permease [Roseiflexaceae bacterium]
MGAYLVRRLLQTVLVMLGVTAITFGAQFLSGDPTLLLLGETKGMTQEQIQAFRHEMGFDRPVLVQYGEWLERAVQGDFGTSLHYRQSNMGLVMERLPATLELTFASLLLALIVSLPLGVLAAIRRNSWIDRIAMLGAMLGQSLPVFWLGIMLILVFGVALKWLPVSGRTGWASLILPAITVGLFSMARNARMIRSSMLEVLGADYVRTARSKGLQERVVVQRHAFRNALIPIVTLIALDFGALLGGAVITEQIFAWPGVGRMVLQAINTKDFPLVQASVTILALTFVLINLATDLLYTALDPRVRLG